MIYIDREHIEFPIPPPFTEKDEFEVRDRLSLRGKYKQARFRSNNNTIQRFRPYVIELFNNKCCYCEQQITDGDVEHFRPKSSVDDEKSTNNEGYYWLAYQWFNIYLSCSVCNRYKGNHFPVKGERLSPPSIEIYEDYKALMDYVDGEQALLIDPCDPKAHQTLNFKYDSDGNLVPQNEKASYSIQFCGLNRTELVKKRKSYYAGLHLVISAIDFKNDHNNNFQFLLDQLREEQEFLGLSRQLIADWFFNEQNTISELYPKEHDEFLNIFENGATPIDVLAKSLQTQSSYKDDDTLEKISKSKTFKFYKFIEWIEIKNYKCIKKVKIEIPLDINETSDVEKGIFLIGENGVGKSSVLQAISLAMMSQEQLDELQLGNVSHLIRRQSRVKRATIRVKFNDHDDIIEVVIDKDKITTNAPTGLVKPTVGIGSIRRLPEDGEEAPFNADLSRIQGLFRHDIIYPDVQPWLGNTELVSTDQFNEAAKTIVEMLLIPQSVIGKDRLLNRRNGKVTINIGEGPESINSMCDGYKSVIAYTLYLMRCFSEYWDSAFNAEGLVIIDEIGNHLHPTWKIRVVSLLRHLFPRTMFIISTHDPLCLRSVQPGEVWVMNKDEATKDVMLSQKDIPPGMPIEDLLLGNWFKMETTLDENTLNIINRHNALMFENKEQNKEEIKEIESTLQERMKYVGGQGLFKDFVKTMDSVLEDTDEASDMDLLQQKLRQKLERKLK